MNEIINKISSTIYDSGDVKEGQSVRGNDSTGSRGRGRSVSNNGSTEYSGYVKEGQPVISNGLTGSRVEGGQIVSNNDLTVSREKGRMSDNALAAAALQRSMGENWRVL